MNFADVPRWAIPYPGESRASWLSATRSAMGLPEKEWSIWVRSSPNEPERPVEGTQWDGLPAGLGDIVNVPVSWRVMPQRRNVVCPRCVVLEDGRLRWPLLVDWLDARCISCSQHLLMLSPRGEVLSEVPVSSDPEFNDLVKWLADWRSAQCTEAAPECFYEYLFRRDLALASARNWSVEQGDIASAEIAWELWERGLRMNVRVRYLPGQPTRLGQLAYCDKLAALIGAYRAWLALRGRGLGMLPRWPDAAWHWLGRRWNASRCSEIATAIAAVLVEIEKIKRRGRRGSAALRPYPGG